MKVRIAVLLLAASLAGCIEADAPDAIKFSAVENPMPAAAEGGHDHRDPEQHRFAENAELVDHMSLSKWRANDQTPIGAHTVAAHGNLIAVGMFGDWAGEGPQGFHLVDVSDPANMQHLSFWDAGAAVKGDRTIAFAQDGQTVFLGLEGGDRPGVVAIDISDPMTPREVANWVDPQDFGSHTISTGTVNDIQYVFSLAAGVNILQYIDGEFTMVGKIVAADGLAVLDSAGYIDPTDPENTYARTYALRTLYGHDMTFYQDPETGRNLLNVAYGYDGFKVFDLAEPTAPTMIARWMPPQDSSHRHYTHSATAERLDDGSLIMVVGTETFEPENQPLASPIWVLDATAVLQGAPMQNQPTHVSTWTNPGQTAAGNLGLSVHFFRQVDGFLYLSHYHGGVWAFDLHTAEDRENIEAFAYIMPLADEPVPLPDECCIADRGFDDDGAPMVMDVAYANGHLFSADLVQGLGSIRLDYPAQL